MFAYKCNFICFSRNTRSNPNIKLKLFNEDIPYAKEIKFLGFILDECLTFKPHIENIKKKCSDRLNIFRILSNKSWKLSHSNLSNIFKCLIGSIIDYSFLTLLSDTNLHKLQIIQNNAIRSILKLPFRTNSTDLSEFGKILSLNYSLPLIARLVDEYNRDFTSRFVNFFDFFSLILTLSKKTYKKTLKSYNWLREPCSVSYSHKKNQSNVQSIIHAHLVEMNGCVLEIKKYNTHFILHSWSSLQGFKTIENYSLTE
ncbi:RNA-directed DNA polymerase from mobile element jockey-like [Brachionus plicatilis]|uniref:RNA-directed DNA polymerase from mobile element jockey-like n=1 Tax=Brachionus plicatilis TaxID=10195 RepID=A0A3M7S9E6_BRAPC|nr:RNA-directed DNA polymerase from mobile element jockey-like [Brachionus plicatilis]